MSSLDGKRRDATDVLGAEVAAAACLAKAIVLAFEVCDQEGAPLTQVQKAAVIEGALIEFDGFETRLDLLAGVGTLLGRPGGAFGDRPAA